MPNSCCAVGCSNRKSKRPDLTFYRIPKDAKRKKLWVQAIKRESWSEQMIVNARVCSEHFETGRWK